MDEEGLETTGKRITINNFFDSIEDIDRVSTNAIQKVTDQQATIEGLTESISEIKVEIAEIQEFIKFQKDQDEDRRLEEEDARQKQEMTERALAVQGGEGGEGDQSPEDQGVSFAENAKQKNIANTEDKKGFFGSLLGLFGSSLLQLPAAALGIADHSLSLNKFNKGGKVEDNDNLTSNNNEDSVLAALTPGEFVITKDAVEKVGVDALKGINAAAGGSNEPKEVEKKSGFFSKLLGRNKDNGIKVFEEGKKGSDFYEKTTEDFSGAGFDVTTETTTREETDDGMITTTEILRERGLSVGVPDLIEHKTQLLGEIHKLKGFEKVTIDNVIDGSTGIPDDKLFEIINKSDAAKATEKKIEEAQKEDFKARNIKPGTGFTISAEDEVAKSLAGTMGYRVGQINPDQKVFGFDEFTSRTREVFKSENDPKFKEAHANAKKSGGVKGYSEGGLVGEDIESGDSPFAGILPPFVDKFKNFAEGLEKSPLGESLKDEKIPKSLESIATDIGTKIDPKDIKDVVIQTVVKKLFGDIEPSAFSPVSDEDIKRENELDSNGRTFELSGASKDLIGGNKEFLDGIQGIADKHNIKASELLGLIASESGFKTDALNESTGAGGLIQFKPEVAEEFGTTVDDIRKMSLSEQLPLIDKYLSKNLPENATTSQLYGSVFMPSYADKDPDFQLLGSGDKFDDGEKITSSIRARYERNSGLDLDGDGFITVGELGSRIENKMSDFGIKDITPQKGGVTPILENKLEDLTNNILSSPSTDVAQNIVSPQEIADQNSPAIVQANAPQVTDVEIKATKTFIPFIQLIQNEEMQINIDESMKELAKIIT